MGLGKSLMTIATICALHKQNRNIRFIVVCPSSLVKNWAQEFDKWIGKASQPRRVIVKGGEEGVKQIKAFGVVKPKQLSEVLIISYDLFRIYQDCLKDVKKIGLLVVDEGTLVPVVLGKQSNTKPLMRISIIFMNPQDIG
jgi:SNF2 family DNA or RNA helicase